ncbi:MAG: hypothetical protein AB1432_05625 [Bacteroidota bacterium]|jgi:hypothetical protein
MPLDRILDCKFINDNDQAQRSAREQLKFIVANKDKLNNVRNGNSYKIAAISLNRCKENFTPKQLSYIDNIYEKVMKGAGYESFSANYKPKKSLRY